MSGIWYSTLCSCAEDWFRFADIKVPFKAFAYKARSACPACIRSANKMNCRTSLLARILSFSALIAVLICCQGVHVVAKEEIQPTAETSLEQEEDGEQLLLSEGDQTGDVEAENRGDFYLPKNCDEQVFEPEEQWKEICKEQHIPPGIEVRMDVNRGKKWGRLAPGSTEAAERSDGNSQGNSVNQVSVDSQGSVKDGEDEEDDSKDPVEQMKKVLGRLPEPDPEMRKALEQRLPPEKMQEILTRVWERRQRELEDAIKRMKTEAQQMHSLLQDLGENTIRYAEGTPNASEAMVINLEDLEYYVGKLDNARDFAKMGGLETCLMLMNHSELTVRETAAWVIGSTVKMEKELQDLALSIGAVPMFLQSINQTVNLNDPETLPTLQQLRLVNKCIYAVGGIVRRNPLAQAQLIEMDGGRLLVHLASNTVAALGQVNATETLDSQQWSKGLVLASKIATLFGDLFNDIPYTPRPRKEPREESDSSNNDDDGPHLTIRKEDGSFTDIDSPSQHGDEVDVSVKMKNFLQGKEVGNWLLTYVEMLSQFVGQAQRDGVQKLELTEDHLDKALQALISAHKGGIFYGASEIDGDLLADAISYLQQLRDRYHALSESTSEDIAMLAEMRRYRVETVLGLMNEYA
eukprot:gb/GECG01004561.1/.p1 GENE.gb/GECG01004561.1/~~gb/GECG01004561.1/.p1  ORF type:complete len:634 (+),score=109.51 gb/GECG01004561.1/:1-1902(+)